jgi:hypothetical protein
MKLEDRHEIPFNINFIPSFKRMRENRIKKKPNSLFACRHIRQIQITDLEGNFVSSVNNGAFVNRLAE